MAVLPPFSQEERHELREVAKDVINGGRVSSWNREGSGKWLPLINFTVMCLGRESAELVHLPYGGLGFVQQPMRTMQAVGVIQEVFADRLRQEYEKHKKGVKRG